MGTQGTGRKRSTKKERSTAEDDALNLIAREAEARLAAKRAARAEAREIRMKELERQQKEIFQVQKKYYGLDTKLDDRSDSKWGDIEQWMEDSERYSRSSRIHTLSDDDERMSVGSRGSVRSDLDTAGAYAGGGSSSLSLKKSKKKKKHKHKDRDRNGYDDEYSVISSRSSRLSDESRASRSSRLDLTSSRLSDDSRVSRASRLDLQPASYASSDLYSFNGLSSSRKPGSAFNGYQFFRSLSQMSQQLYRRSSLYEDSLCSASRRVVGSTSHPLEYSSYRSSGSRASSRANSARTSPVDNCGSVASFLRSAASSSGLPRDLDDVTIPDFSDVEDRDYLEKGSRAASALTAGTLTSLGGSSSRRGSGETAITVDAETSIREIKEIHELKDQIQDVETKYTQNLKEAKDALAEVEEKYRKAMVSNAQLDNEKNNLMYQVDTLKDSLMELEEQLSESHRGYEEKVKEFEREKHAHSVLQFQFSEMKEMLKQSEELLNEIRLMGIKQEGYVREISDLQETVEWKDKKIGALERQKEYTDAIRIERDELREEVVNLKDILKKHGIVLGPDLNINGGIGEAEADGSPSADPASPPASDTLTSPAEGNSMLGNTEETQLRSSGEEEVDPEQHQEMFEDAKENLLSSDTVCNVSILETTSDEQPTQEQQTCLATEEDNVEETDLNKDLNVDISECSITESKDIINGSLGLQGLVTSSEENAPETETPEGRDSGETSNPDLEKTDTKSSSVDTHSDDIKESCNNTSEEQETKQEDVEQTNLRNTESCHQQKVEQDVLKESLPNEPDPAVSNTEPQQEPEKAEEAENDEAEEISSKSQSTASGKKKRKKRRGKKKGGTQEDKNQQKDETDKEKGKTEKDIELVTKDNGQKTEPDIDGSVTETLKESQVDQVKNEQDRQETEEVDGVEAMKPTETFSHNETAKESRKDHVTEEHDKEQTLETDKVEEVEAVTTTEAFSLKEISVTDEQNEKLSLETQTVEAVEAVPPSETFSHIETLKESSTDARSDEQDKEQSLETENVEEVEAVITTETYSQDETVKEIRDTDEHNEEQALKTETVEAVEAVTPTETFSHVETLEESSMDPKKEEKDKEQSLETETIVVEAVAPTETSSLLETLKESSMDLKTDEQDKEQSLETETVEVVEAVAPTETSSLLETLKESSMDPNNDQQDKEQSLEKQQAEESITSPVPEANLSTPDLIDNPIGAENSDGTSSVDSSKSGKDISTNGSLIHTESETVDSAKVGSIDEMKCTTSDPENDLETNGTENTEAESHVPSNDDIATDESQSTNNSEGKDNTLVSLSSTDGFTEDLKSLSGSEPPPELSAARNSGSDDTLIKFDEDPDEAPETIKESPSPDGVNPELKPEKTEKEELNGDLKEPEGLVEPDSSSHEEKSEDGCDTDALDTEKSLLETGAQAEQLDDVEIQTLQRDDQIGEANAEASSEKEVSTVDILNTPDSPKEATDIGSSVEQDHSTEESAAEQDPEHKNSQNDQQSDLELHESSKDESEDNASSQPILQDSDEEDVEEDEGLSFDFDDMDMEVAIATNLPKSLQQEEVEEGVEVMSDESNNGSSGQSVTESNENTQDEPVENNDEMCTVDGGNQVDSLDTESDTVTHEDATSENVPEEQKNTAEEDVVVAEESVIEEDKVLIVGESDVVTENINQVPSLPVEEGLDAIKNELQGQDSVLPKSADQVASNKEPPLSRKDVKKNSKKGKAKGKEECKMS